MVCPLKCRGWKRHRKGHESATDSATKCGTRGGVLWPPGRFSDGIPLNVQKRKTPEGRFLWLPGVLVHFSRCCSVPLFCAQAFLV